MNIDAFENSLKELNLNKKDFSSLTGVAYQTIINWGSTNKIPSWVDSWIQNYKFKNFYDVVKTEFDKQKDI